MQVVTGFELFERFSRLKQATGALDGLIQALEFRANLEQVFAEAGSDGSPVDWARAFSYGGA